MAHTCKSSVWGQSQEEQESKASFDYIASWRSIWAKNDPTSKINKGQRKKERVLPIYFKGLNRETEQGRFPGKLQTPSSRSPSSFQRSRRSEQTPGAVNSAQCQKGNDPNGRQGTVSSPCHWKWVALACGFKPLSSYELKWHLLGLRTQTTSDWRAKAVRDPAMAI